jgi:hypothetical protein
MPLGGGLKNTEVILNYTNFLSFRIKYKTNLLNHWPAIDEIKFVSKFYGLHYIKFCYSFLLVDLKI